jgi:hypothetical protein
MLPRTRLETVRTAPRPISTGHLLADCERWCRDVLPPRSSWVPRSAPRVVRAPRDPASLRTAARRLTVAA